MSSGSSYIIRVSHGGHSYIQSWFYKSLHGAQACPAGLMTPQCWTSEAETHPEGMRDQAESDRLPGLDGKDQGARGAPKRERRAAVDGTVSTRQLLS